MALLSSDQTYIRLADNEGETVQTSFNVGGAITLQQRTDLLAAVKAMTLGATVEQGYTDRSIENAIKRSSNVLAQADIRWRAVYQTLNGTEYTYSIGTADLSLKKDGEELMDNTAPEYTAFETIFNAVVKSPNGDAVTLKRIEYYKA